MQSVDDIPDLELLALFEALHRERHLTRAARRTGRSQPTMSRALARLRGAFGDELFVRTPRGMVPTPRADALAPEVRRVLDAARSLVRARAFDPAALDRTFVIATTDLVEAHMLSALSEAVREGAPRASLLLRPVDGNLGADLESGRIDLAIVPRVSIPEGTIQRHLFDDEFLCAVRRGHPALRRPLSLEAWAALPHVQIAPRGVPGGPVDDALTARGLSRRVVVRTPSFLAAPLLVSRSDYVITAPRLLLSAVAEPLGLHTFAPPLPIPGFRVHQGWHPRAHEDPAHVWLRGVVADAARAAARPPGRRPR